MATGEITNPEAVRLTNEMVRTVADKAVRYYYAAKAILNEWAATDMGTKIPNTSDVIVDGSATDGRHPITGANVNGLMSHLQAMVDDLEANGNLKLNILLGIEVNGRP
jgi:hypothetical protein